jgi:hypothetical protein
MPRARKVKAGKVMVSHTMAGPLRFRFIEGVVVVPPGEEVEFDAHAWKVFTSSQGRGRGLALLVARGELKVRG